MNTTPMMNINQVLNQIKIRSQYMPPLAESNQPQRVNFSSLLEQTLGEVSQAQGAASVMKTAYERGDGDIDLPEVMIASQKASLSFEAVVEVRNRVLNAYQEIMNMQI